jgi:Arsenical resistance operon protein ArsD
MPTVKVFDPPMCCSTGLCGPEPDPALARFAADLQWLQSQGVVVERFSLSQQPDKFTKDATVMHAMNSRGADVLPIVMVNDQIVAERQYPSREQLGSRLGLAVSASSAAPESGGCCCGPGGCS